MAKNKRDKKLADFLLRAKFAHPDKDENLPLPSLEDIRDSQKTGFFSVKNEDKDRQE